MIDARLGVDALRGVVPADGRKDTHWLQSSTAKEQKKVGEPLNKEFKQAIHGVFAIDNGLEIDEQTQIKNISSPLMKALDAGFKYFHSLGKTDYDKEQRARLFLDGMSYVNRGEEKYATNFAQAVSIMAGYEVIEAKNDFDRDFTEERIKIERNGWQGLGVALRGEVRQFLGYESVRKLLNNFFDRTEHAAKVAEIIAGKAMVKDQPQKAFV